MSQKHPEPERKFLVRSFSSKILMPSAAMWRKTIFFPMERVGSISRIRAEITWPNFSPASVVENTPDPSEDSEELWSAFYDTKERDLEGTWQSQTEESREIPPKTAWDIFRLNVYPWITKVRYRIPHGEQTIELDIFTKPALRGLVIAEVELRAPDEEVLLPSWTRESVEVTEDTRFQNVNLSNITSLDELNLQEVRQ